MTSRINAKQPLRKAQTAGSPNPANPHAPSVPISLYREVAIELKATQTKMESLTQQNQHLTHQNQQLRVEIERVVQSALQLRQVADAHLPTPTLPASPQGLELHFQSPAAAPPQGADTIAPERPELKPTAPNLFTEQEAKLRHSSPTERRAEKMGGWWLAIIICFIVVTAFGTGFLIVRPLLPSR